MPTMTRPALTPDALAHLLDELDRERPEPYVFPDGTKVRAWKDYRDDTRLDEGDCWGTLKYTETRWPHGYSKAPRPAGFNGAARKFDVRNGYVWWQPPADVVRDPVALAAMAERVRGWCREEWTYVGVRLEVTPPPCEHGKLAPLSASLWGVESDAAGEHLVEILTDLYAECAQ